MPYSDYSNKPASELLASRLTNNKKNTVNTSGVSRHTTHQLANKELKHIESTSGSSSSSQPQQIQSSGEASKQTKSPPDSKINLSIGTLDTFSPVVKIQLSNKKAMSSDDDSPKAAKKASRRSSVDGTKKKKKSSRRKSNEVDGRKKDKDKEEKPNGEDVDDVRRNKMAKSRDVSFSGSTIKRVEAKESSQSSLLGDSSDSLQSALKKTSKYGKSSSGDDSADEEKPRARISFGDVTAAAAVSVAAPPPQAMDTAAMERRKSMFKRAAAGGSAKSIQADPPAENGTPVRRAFSEGDRPAADEMYPRTEPMQRRSSTSNLVKRKSISVVGTEGKDPGPLGNMKSRKTLLAGSLAGTSVEQLRRSAMSADDQIYV